MALWLIITDLDGTLLDTDTYDWKDALQAVQYLKKENYPIIPCTSKTHLEILGIMNNLRIEGPFISENGSALFLPRNHFELPEAESNYDEQYKAIVLGKPYTQILHFFNTFVNFFSIPAKGLSQMSLTEIQTLTNLDESEARLVQNRFFSEPFILTRPFTLNSTIRSYVEQNGYRLLRGNRFYHLLGNSDKGNAVSALLNLYQKKYPGEKIISMVIGDSKNDLEMLHAADYPVMVKGKSGKHTQATGINNIYYSPEIGPKGWAEAVFKFVR